MDTLVVAAAVGILMLALVFGVILPGRRRRTLRHGPIPLAAFGRSEQAAIPPRPSRLSPTSVAAQDAEAVDPLEGTSSTAASSTPRAVATAASSAELRTPPRNAPAMPVQMRAMELEQAANDDRARVKRKHVAGDRRDAVRDERSAVTLRLERPNDGTLAFLPGRLEIIEGRDVGQEVKFVRTPGPDGTTITFGRSEGAHYRHVQLHEPTVSRQHAKLTLDGTSWSLVNLSATNPVVVNGLAVTGVGSTVVLREGDRIEMGEVVFRFRVK